MPAQLQLDMHVLIMRVAGLASALNLSLPLPVQEGGPAAAAARFDAFAALLAAPGTLNAAAALLSRLEARLQLSQQRQRRRSGSGSGSNGSGTAADSRDPAAGERAFRRALGLLHPAAVGRGEVIPRYPQRVFLAVYMIKVRPPMCCNCSGCIEVVHTVLWLTSLSPASALYL